MGFFSWLGEKISDAADAFMDKVAEVKWWVEDRIDDIRDFFSDPGHLDENSSALDTAKIQKRLTEMRDRNEKNISKHTAIFEEALAEHFHSIIDDMKQDKKKLERYHIDLDSYEEDIDKIVNNMGTKIKDLFAKRLSMDDEECLEILSIQDASERTKEQLQFAKKVLREGREQLLKEFKKSSDKLFYNLQKTIGDALDDNEIKFKESKSELQRLLDCDKNEADQIWLKAQITYDTCAIARVYLS